MPADFGVLSLLPPLVAIALALLTRQVHLSLFSGIWLGATLLSAYNPISGAAGAIEHVVAVLNDHDDAEVLLFTLAVGALIALMRDSGGVKGFADWMVQRGWVRGPRSAQLISAGLGISIFIESNITCLITGTVSRPLYDRVGSSRAKLAYVCDSTSAPICVLIPLNAWGAMIIGLLATQGVDDPLGVLIAAVPLNFYALLAILLVFVVAVTGWEIGPMRAAEARARAGPGGSDAGELPRHPDLPPVVGGPQGGKGEHPLNLLLPIVATVTMMPVVLYITGDGNWQAGSGSTAVLWAVSFGLLVAMVSYRLQGLFSIVELVERAIKGCQELLGVAAILALALALGDICNELGTGPWVAAAVEPWLGAATVAPLVFLTGCAISFSTGSSWGTFAILMPIAIPMATAIGTPLALATAAVMGGGIFGDHCSPISDTTVISSLSAGVDHIEHVTTQLPYALIAGVGATLLYLVAGWIVTL